MLKVLTDWRPHPFRWRRRRRRRRNVFEYLVWFRNPCVYPPPPPRPLPRYYHIIATSDRLGESRGDDARRNWTVGTEWVSRECPSLHVRWCALVDREQKPLLTSCLISSFRSRAKIKTGRQRTARHGVGAGRQGHAREGRWYRS
jgi:hypothetical protein